VEAVTDDEARRLTDRIFDVLEGSQVDRGATPNFTYEDVQKVAEAVGTELEQLRGVIDKVVNLHAGLGKHECPAIDSAYGEVTDYEAQCLTLRLIASARRDTPRSPRVDG
jgi:hypothetical protein